MGPTVAASAVDSSEGGSTIKKKGIRRLLTPAIFTSNNKAADVGGAASPSGSAHNVVNRQSKTLIETAFVSNNNNSTGNGINNNNNGSGNSAGNAVYRLQQQQLQQQMQQQQQLQLQQQQHQLQRVRYLQGLNRHVNPANDFRSRSVSPGSLDRDVNANYGVGRRADSACSLASSSSSTCVAATPDYSGSSPSSSGRRSAPIIPYSQYYNNRNGGPPQQQPRQQQRFLLMPVGAQVKITGPPPSAAAYAAAVHQQQQQQQQQVVIYGNVPATAAERGPFTRGSPQRATIGCTRESPSRQSTIYETEEDAAAVAGGGQKRFQPIFKRGALQAPPEEPATVASASPKRVSFSPQPLVTAPGSSHSSEPAAYWPTKKGPSPLPPTRRRTADAPTAAAADRPLPPVPKRSPSTSAIYGTLRNLGNGPKQQPQVLQNRWCPPSPQHHYHHQQSGSESGSEAGEVQRILNAKNGHLVIGKYITS